MLEEFTEYLVKEGKSINTIKTYVLQVNLYLKWFVETYGSKCQRLYRENILDYKSYLKNVSKLSASTINSKLAALIKYNKFLVSVSIQTDMVLSKNDNIKSQSLGVSPSDISQKDVEMFRQKILENGSKRDYAIVTLLAYAGLRISEALNIKMDDFNIVSRELIVRDGKGEKERLVYLGDKIINALRIYLKARNSNSMYLFISRQGDRLSRSRINQIFNDYSDIITPHKLRHFYCSHALESGYSVHEVANQAGHSNIHTTLTYTNPTKEKMKDKANKL